MLRVSFAEAEDSDLGEKVIEYKVPLASDSETCVIDAYGYGADKGGNEATKKVRLALLAANKLRNVVKSFGKACRKSWVRDFVSFN